MFLGRGPLGGRVSSHDDGCAFDEAAVQRLQRAMQVDGLGPVDVLRATLPAGTVSGAPKVRAMEIIDELEPVKRGPYAGVVGYIDWSGNLDTAIAIRTMFVGPTGASLQAGAGIVADSIAEEEDLECANKARGLLVALPAAARMSRNREASGRRA